LHAGAAGQGSPGGGVGGRDGRHELQNAGVSDEASAPVRESGEYNGGSGAKRPVVGHGAAHRPRKSPPSANGTGSGEGVPDLQRLLKEQEVHLKEVTEKYEALRKQEEENVLLLAQTKQAIHTELEHRGTEVSQRDPQQ